MESGCGLAVNAGQNKSTVWSAGAAQPCPKFLAGRIGTGSNAWVDWCYENARIDQDLDLFQVSRALSSGAGSSESALNALCTMNQRGHSLAQVTGEHASLVRAPECRLCGLRADSSKVYRCC